MKSVHLTLVRGAALLLAAVVGAGFSLHADDVPEQQEAKGEPDTARVLNLRSASIPVNLEVDPALGANGRPFLVGHTLKDAWAAKVASGNPRSPAAESGVVVVGSGRGSAVWGYDGESGKRKWKDTSKDSGISDIVIGLGRAYYTTYSCTLEGVDITTGKHLFTKWLAPTVSCAPGTDNNVIACAYNKGDGYKLSLHNKSGGLKWQRPAGSGVVHAPVVYEEGVYVSNVDGTLRRFSETGKAEWSVDFGVVAPPVPTPWGLLVTTTWSPEEDAGAKVERPMTEAERKEWERGTVSTTAALKGTVVAARDRRIALIKDPTSAPAGKSKIRLTGPRSSLDYQGVRPGVSNSHVIFAYDGRISCVNPAAGRAIWSVEVSGKGVGFATPLCHEGLVIVAGNDGVLAAIEEDTGALVWSYEFKGHSFVSMPAADGDRVFATTSSGVLVSLPIGSENLELGRPRTGASVDAEGTASIYARVQETFRKVRNVVREVEEPQDVADEPAPDAERGDRREGGAPGPAPEDDAARRDEDEAEDISRGQWERREERRAERGRPNGQPYEKKPFKRE